MLCACQKTARLQIRRPAVAEEKLFLLSPECKQRTLVCRKTDCWQTRRPLAEREMRKCKDKCSYTVDPLTVDVLNYLPKVDLRVNRAPLDLSREESRYLRSCRYALPRRMIV
jgi:hypothetical protein